MVQSTIGAAFINTGDARGVGFIMNALSRAVIFPNIYWNNVRAIHGYIEAIWTALYLVDKIKQENLPYLKKYDSFSCKSCEYLHSCKPWLNVNGGE